MLFDIQFVQADPSFVHAQDMTSGHTACWNNLCIELWVNIISRLEESFDPKLAWNSRHRLKECAQTRSDIQELRLVCSNLNIALNDAQLLSSVFLREGLQNWKLPSLLQCLHRQRTSLQLFAIAAKSPILETALGALACPGSQLALAYIANISTAAVHILSCHTGLHCIDIGSGAEKYIDLTPLAALPYLGELVISRAEFGCDKQLLHLTNLQLHSACVFTPTVGSFLQLLKMRLTSSRCVCDGLGLVSCHNLKELTLSHCFFGALSDEDHVELRFNLDTHMPTGMSALSQLTKLDVTVDRALCSTQLLWLTSLVSLQDLGFHAMDDVDIPCEVSDLMSLTKLRLSVPGVPGTFTEACMDLQLDWQDMPALQSLLIGPGLYSSFTDLLQLVGCTKLKTLCFDSVRPDSAGCAEIFAGLAGILAVSRPDVTCYLDQVQVSHMIQ